MTGWGDGAVMYTMCSYVVTGFGAPGREWCLVL
jgi:hypothetical protein